ncbi:unnamed protein product [Hymenolepis diminuta]|uniref:Uncharacterized protein n=1 Tax=Hymenolepis diminuta TaxID=6216 RepID=A0A564Z4W8_HYMDI|nr:unnamed protein product [Hymenolepis diminuta]
MSKKNDSTFAVFVDEVKVLKKTTTTIQIVVTMLTIELSQVNRNSISFASLSEADGLEG